MSGIAVQKAMERIKIPKKIINIINCLLENRSNRVITFHGLTEPYTVHDGIDQGDSISPLLWRIFYDPLLDAVNKSNLGYVMSTNGNKPEESELSNHLTQRIYATVYMDDTVWLADNKVNLQKILNITQEFCKLVDININPMKSQVIHVNPKKTDRLSTVSMNGQDITPVGKHTPVRYLGVWLTQSGKKSFQKNLILDKVLNVIKTINWKKTTDKQVRYIINQVLFPQIEYLLSDMMISKSLCVKINSKILSFFKHKAGFAKTAINSLFFMSDGYKIFNIKDRQLQLHACNWVQRINANNLVGTSTRIRLQQFQNEAWQTESVLTNPVIVKIKSGHNLTGDILEHLKENDFTFPTTDTNGNMIVLPSGGACPIIDYVETDWYMENRSGLRHKQIFFLDQLFNLDFSSLLEWPHFLTLNNCKAMGRIPKWFNELHELLNMNNCQEIIEFLKMVHNNINPFFDLTRPNDLKQGAWYSQTLHHNLVFGKEIKPRLRDNVTEDQVLVQHYLQLGKNLEPTSVLLPCDKCPLNTHNQNDNNRCLMIFEKDEVLLTPVKKSSVSTSNTLPKKIKPRIRIPLKDLEKIHEFAAEQREQSDEVIDMTLSPPASPNEDNRIEESESYSNDKSDKISDPESIANRNQEKMTFLEKWFSTPKTVLLLLDKAASQLENTDSFSVYTDGSKEDRKGNNLMGLGWVIPIAANIPKQIEFSGKTEFFPSSTKAELMAIITAIAVAPQGCTIDIFSDSQGAISIMKNIVNKSEIQLKNMINNGNNPGMVLVAQQIIKDLDLKIVLHKVKAHTGDEYNEIADNLAKIRMSPYGNPRIKLNFEALDKIKVIPTWKNLSLDCSIKTTIKKLNNEIWTQKWLNQNRNKWWIRTNKAKKVNWKLTWTSLHPSKITSFTSSTEEASIRKFSLKLFNDELPTLVNLHKRNPNIYKSKTCPFCKTDIENNIHIFTCTAGNNINRLAIIKRKFIKNIVHESANFLKENNTLDKIKKEMENFTANFENNDIRLMEFNEICFMDIIAGLIPNALYTLLNKVINDSVNTKQIILKSMRSFKFDLFELWKQRCENFIIWERCINITTNIKKNNKRKKLPTQEQLNNIVDIISYDEFPEIDSDNLNNKNNNNNYLVSYNKSIELAGIWLYAKFIKGLSNFGVSCYFKIN
jgi:ribonuclease HI